MKVHASFPIACRAEQAVHAPAEPAEPLQRHTRSGRASGTGAALQDEAVLRVRRYGRAFPTTRPHPGGTDHGHGIGP